MTLLTSPTLSATYNPYDRNVQQLILPKKLDGQLRRHITLDNVQVYGRLHRVGRDASVDARVLGHGPLDEEVAGGLLAFLDH